ncbi:MAG: cytochrome P450 [Rhodospirillaceae bacterium]|nr:cytochrome P450 [Rhodospirillaceae bacterium]
MSGSEPLRGPKGYPILGVLPMLKNNTLKFLKETVETYGDLVPLRVLMQTAYLLNHPSHVEHVLQRNHKNYRKTPMLEKLRPVLGDGLFMSEGELWTRQRNLIQPSFHRQRIDALAGRMVEVVADWMKQWQRHAASSKPFNISDDTSFLTLEIALQTFFGASLGQDGPAFAEAMKVVHDVSAKRIWNLTSITELLPTRENRAFKQAVALLHAVVGRIITERRQTKAHHDDLLAVLMDARDSETNEAMNDKQLRDEVMTLMLAGHDTTATMMAWALLILTQHPEHLENMRHEVDTVLAGRLPEAADLKNLVVTKRAIQEIARLRPSFWWFARVAIADDVIGGQPIKAGTTVFISQYLIQNSPKLWDEPEKFDPDRFLPERIAQRSRFAYFPFGAGPRVCVGSNFALMEMQFSLAMMFRMFDVKITSDPNPQFGNLITLRPTDDIWATVSPRLRH